MRRQLYYSLVLAMALMAPRPVAARELIDLEQAVDRLVSRIVESARQIKKANPAEFDVAVGDLVIANRSYTDEGLAGLLRGKITNALVDAQAFRSVLERNRLADLLKEQGRSLEAVFDESTVKAVGRLTAANAFLVGGMTISPQGVLVQARLLRMVDAHVLGKAEVEILRDDRVNALIREIKAVEPVSPVVTQTVTQIRVITMTVAPTVTPPAAVDATEPSAEPPSALARLVELRVPLLAAGVAVAALLAALLRRKKGCPNCGNTEIVKGDNFCQKCGQTLK